MTLTLCAGVLAFLAGAQCTVKVNCEPLANYCGSPFFPRALGDANDYIVTYKNDFNSKTLGAGWANTTPLTFDNLCDNGPDNSPYAWVSGGSDKNRNISTVDFDVSKGGKLCFDFRMAEVNGTNGAPPGCEAPDQPSEGVHVQYSTDGGITWIDLDYLDPSPFPRPQYTQWNNYCYLLPEEAVSSNTRFRWFQAEASGDDVDHWGIDNVKILTNNPNYEYIWDHSPVRSPKPGGHIPGASSFTYHVVYKDKNSNKQCEASITVSVIQPQITVTPSPVTICNGGSATISGQYSFPVQVNSCGTESRGCMGPSGTQTIGGESVTQPDFFRNGSAGSQRNQFIIRASELTFKKGQISGFSLFAKDNGIVSKIFYNFSVKIGCTSTNAYGSSPVTALTTVFNRESFSIKDGINLIDFDNVYNWNGTQNLVIEICWSNPQLKGDLPLKGDNLAWNASFVVSGGVKLNSICNNASGSAGTFRPKIAFNYCNPPEPELSYKWTPAATLSADNTPSPLASPSTTTTYQVEIWDKNTPYCKVNGSVKVEVKDITSGADTSVTLCRKDGNVNLYGFFNGKAIAGGTWKDPTGLVHTGTINPISATPGVYKYTVNDPTCGTLESKLNLSFEDPLDPGTDGSTTVCGLETAVKLFPLLGGTPDAGGIWKDNNNSGALSNGVFNPSKVNPGTYTFSYLIQATANCPSDTAFVTVASIAPPNAGVNTLLTVCSSSGVIDIFKALNGNPDVGGTWTNNNGVGTLSGNSLNLSGVPEGSYTFTYKVSSSYCPMAQAILTIQVLAQPNAGSDGSITICQSAGSLNLFTVLGGTPNTGGKWADLNVTGKMSPTGILTLQGLSGTYKFRYTMSTSGCPSSVATVTVTVVKQNSAGTGRDTLICGTGSFNLATLLSGSSAGGIWSDLNLTGRLSGSTFSMNGLAAGSYSFSYTIGSPAPCTNQSVTVTVDTEKEAIAGSGSTMKLCKGEILELHDELGGSPAANGSWYSVPTLSGLSNISGYLNTEFSDTGNYTVYFVVNGKAPCVNDTAVFNIEINDAPTVSNLVYTCINQNKQYQVEFEVSGGDRNTYSFTPLGTKIPAVPFRFRSAPITSKTSKIIYVDDANGCGPTEVEVYFDCGCITQAGTVDNTDTLDLCEKEDAIAVHDNGFINDGNDTLVFVLHEGAGSKIINPIAWSTKPRFGFQSPMQFYKVYYISPVAGNKGGARGYDILDTCLDIGAGTPVKFRPLPDFSYLVNTPVCQGELVVCNLNFYKSKAPYKVDYSWLGTPGSRTFNDSVGQLSFVASTSGDLILSKIIAQGCTATFTQTIPVIVQDTLTVKNFTFTCNNDNTAYTIDFDISGGKPGAYVVNGLSGTFTGNHFTSIELASPSAYNFNVSDGSICLPRVFNSTHICPCVSRGGTMSSTSLIKVCGDDTAKAKFQNNFVRDGNDRSYFILHSNSIGIGQIYDTSDVPFFTYLPQLNYGTRYYISAITGDSLNGFVDTNDRCVSKSQVVPVEFYPQPSGILAGDTNICEGTALDLMPILFGTGPFSIAINDQTGKVYNFPNIGFTSPVIVTPPPGNYTFKFNRLRDLGSGCLGDTSGMYQVRVIPAPKADLSGDTSYCDHAGQVHIRAIFSGKAPFSGDLMANGVLVNSFSGEDSLYDFFHQPAPGKIVYVISNLRDNSLAACPGITNDTVKVEVFPIAHIQLSGNDSTCAGGPRWLMLRASNIYNGYPGQYKLNIRELPSNNLISHTFTGISDSVLVIPPDGLNTYTIESATDLKSGCTATFGGASSLKAFARPVALIKGDSSFCENSPNRARVLLSVQGTGTNTIYYSDSHDNHYSYSLIQKTGFDSVFHNLPSGITGFFIDSVTDGSGLACKGQFSGNAQIRVNAIPVASLNINNSNSLTICRGDSADLNLQISGTLPIAFRLMANGSLFKTDTLKSSNTKTYRVSSASDQDYVVDLPRDGNTPVCQGVSSNTVHLGIQQKPAVSLSLVAPVVCEGQPVVLQITPTAGSTPIEIRYSVDLGPASNPVVVGSGGAQENLMLSAGTHSISIVSIRDLSPLACLGNPNSIPTVQAVVRALPAALSLSATPNPVCYATASQVSYSANIAAPLQATFSTIDSNWTRTFSGSDNFTYGPLFANRSVRLTSLAYQTTPACAVSLTDKVDISVNQVPTAKVINPDTTVCEGDPFPLTILLTGTGNISGTIESPTGESFSFGPATSYTIILVNAKQSGYFRFPLLSVMDANGCKGIGEDSVLVTVNPLPVVDFIAQPQGQCEPLLTRLYNTTAAQHLGGGCFWNVGNGLYTFSSCDSSPSLTFDKPGNYDVSLTVTSTDGCTKTLSRPGFLSSWPNPIADFSYNPNPVMVSNPVVYFIDRSIGAAAWEWDFGIYGESDLKSPVMEFPAEGELQIPVQLVVSSEHGCLDTIKDSFRIMGELFVNVPNSFTPNTDDKNDLFHPVCYGHDEMNGYLFQVFSRWGELLFETTDPNAGWDGTAKGNPAQLGTYAWKVKVSSKYSKEIQEYAGHVNLIR